jgi:predicted DNA-binding transcriptional regulator YafY
MRAGRVIELLLILQRRGVTTAAQLAAELEVSERTILRDIDELSGAGVPVFGTRGPGGGFRLLENDIPGLEPIRTTSSAISRRTGSRRATVRISPDGRRLAALLCRLQPLRISRTAPIDGRGWHQASFRLGGLDGAVVDVMSLGPEIEVIGPPELRRRVADQTTRTAKLYARHPPMAAG